MFSQSKEFFNVHIYRNHIGPNSIIFQVLKTLSKQQRLIISTKKYRFFFFVKKYPGLKEHEEKV